MDVFYIKRSTVQKQGPQIKTMPTLSWKGPHSDRNFKTLSFWKGLQFEKLFTFNAKKVHTVEIVPSQFKSYAHTWSQINFTGKTHNLKL